MLGFLRSVLVAAVVTSIAACPSDPKPVNSCIVDAECPIGAICKGTRCVAGCRSSNDCAATEYCSLFGEECRACTPGIRGCPCTGSGTCLGDLGCCAETKLCQYECGTSSCGNGECDNGESSESCSVDCSDYSTPGAPSSVENNGMRPECARIALPPTTYACQQVDLNRNAALGTIYALWRTAPGGFCPYYSNDGIEEASACGPLNQDGAWYCDTDQSISWDKDWMDQVDASFSNFTDQVVLAHEWGHHNQRVSGWPAGFNKIRELHADCQAGIYSAIQQAAGNFSATDKLAAFGLACTLGDTSPLPNWAPNAHGTCNERMAAFGHGYYTTFSYFIALCPDTTAPPLSAEQRLGIMRQICDIPGVTP